MTKAEEDAYRAKGGKVTYLAIDDRTDPKDIVYFRNYVNFYAIPTSEVKA